MRIDVKGTIVSDDLKEVYEWFGIASTCPSDVRNAIKKAEEENDNELTLVINSGGGSVWAGSEMFYDLKNFKGTVKAEIPSVAASAASFLAMAADTVSMSILGQMMVHNASTSARGNYMDMNATSEFLQSTDRAIINAYMLKTKKTENELQTLMDKTTWMNAQQAKDLGFIDEILFEDNRGANNIDASGDKLGVLLPPEAIDKARDAIAASRGIADPVNHIGNQKEPKNEGGNKTMDLQTLQNDHPELFNQVKKLGYADGVKAENKRIQEIEEIAVPGNEELINDAKFVNPVPAAKFAINALKAQKEQGLQQLQNMQTDAAPLDKVPGSNAPIADLEDDVDKEAKALADIFKGAE